MKRVGTLLGNPLWDLVAFMIGLGLAWSLGWETRDLIWGLWLSSLTIGYLSIVVGLVGGLSRTVAGNHPMGLAIGLAGALFMLAFFTVHFGGFHFVHSVFLAQYFPINGVGEGSFGPGLEGYLVVLSSYWPWLVAAAIAERGMLAEAWRGRVSRQPGTGKPHPAAKTGFDPSRAYVNVIRMHLLIFFFAGASVLRLEHFGIYAVVYAVYFFPWSFLKEWRKTARVAATG